MINMPETNNNNQPSSCLSKRQLSMFQRTVGPPSDASKVALPKRLLRKPFLRLSKKDVSFDKAMELAKTEGGRLATLREAVMDKRFMLHYAGTWFFVGCKEAPKKNGWYRISRQNGRLEAVPQAIAETLPMDERLYVYRSALETAEKGLPLAVLAGEEMKSLGGGNTWNRVTLEGDYGNNEYRVAIARERT